MAHVRLREIMKYRIRELGMVCEQLFESIP